MAFRGLSVSEELYQPPDGSGIPSPSRTRESPVIAVQLSRQHVIDLLLRVGLTEMAEAALHDLPDPVDREDVAAWGGKWDIDMDYFINRMGGSP